MKGKSEAPMLAGDRTESRAGRRVGAVAGALALVAGAIVASSPVGAGGEGQETGAIAGRVTVTEAPEPRMVEVTADQPVCGDEVEDRAVVVDGSGGLANAVILVAGVPWAMSGPSRSSTTRAATSSRASRWRRRDPSSPSGARTTCSTRHTPYDDRQRTLFNIAIPFPGLEIRRPLRRPGPVRIECDSHGWMRGWIYVSNDVGTVTGAGGRYELSASRPAPMT